MVDAMRKVIFDFPIHSIYFTSQRLTLACLLALPLAGATCASTATAQSMDGVIFVDDLEQELRSRQSHAQRQQTSTINQAAAAQQAATQQAMARQQAALRAKGLAASKQAASQHASQQSSKGWGGFKNPLSGWFGGDKEDSNTSRPQPSRATAQRAGTQRAGSNPNQGGSVAFATDQSGTTRPGGLATRTTGTGNQPRGLFQLGNSSKDIKGIPASSAVSQAAATRQATVSRQTLAAQQREIDARVATKAESNKPSWTDRFAMPFARKKSNTQATKTASTDRLPAPSYRDTVANEASVAMVSDRDESPKVSSNVKLASKQTPVTKQTKQSSSPATLNDTASKATPYATKQAGGPLPQVVTPPQIDGKTLVAKQKQLMDQQADYTAKQKRASQAMARSAKLPTQPVAREVTNPHVATIPAKKPTSTSDNSGWQNPAASRGTPVAMGNMPANPVKLQPVAKPMPKPATVRAAKPSEKSVELLSRANSLSQSAETEEEFSSVIQLCRHVLAIDDAPTAVDYSHELAGWALNRRGEVKAEQGRNKEALLDFEDALRLNPKRWRAIHNRGVLAAQAGRFDDAFDDFNRTIEINPKFAKAYSNRATLYVQADKLELASEDYRQAIANDPDLAVAHKGRGHVCHSLGQYDLSIQHYDAAMLLAPNDARIVNNRGDLLNDMGRYRAAEASYEKAVAMNPALGAAYRNLAWLQATCPDKECRDPEQAIDNANQALQLCDTPGDLEYDTLAAAQASAGNFESASSTMDKALELAQEQDKPSYAWRKGLYEKQQPYIAEPASAVQQASFAQ